MLIFQRSFSDERNSNKPKKHGGKEAKESAADDFELFGSSDEEEDSEKQRVIQERLKAYAEKKAKKPASIAKSSVILDVKPWDDETDMAEMEKRVRAIEQDGLLWGGSKLIPLAYGLKKLQIVCTIEDEKVSVDDLIDKMVEDISEHVQSVDIVAFNKI
uniref:Elongation factor 1-beta n=1 Tax=Syphacia muris TaxID=451379 RepID=A0A0N5AZR8_9BILA